MSLPQPYMPVSDQAGQMWTQPAMPKMPMPVKQPFFMPAQDPMKLFEHSMSPAVPMQPQPSMDKKMKFPEVKMQDFYWEPPYRMGEARSSMADRMGKHPPGVFCPDQESAPRGPPYEVRFLHPQSLTAASLETVRAGWSREFHFSLPPSD